MKSKIASGQAPVYFIQTCQFLSVLLLIFLLGALLRNGRHVSAPSIALCVAVLLLCAVSFFLQFQLFRMINQLQRVITKLTAKPPSAQTGSSRRRPWQFLIDASANLETLFARYEAAISREYESELLRRQAQFTALQSQINPHFLYNTLESIRGDALRAGAPMIAETTEALSRFFRYNISQKGDFVTIADELNNIKNYFQILQYRFQARFLLKIISEDDDQLSALYIPKLTLQPLVENAIRHGLEPKAGIGTVTIRITVTIRHLVICVSDNGLGMDEVALQALRGSLSAGHTGKNKKSSLGLYNVDQRIKTFFGEFYGLNVESTPDIGTDITLRFPLTTEFPDISAQNWEANR